MWWEKKTFPYPEHQLTSRKAAPALIRSIEDIIPSTEEEVGFDRAIIFSNAVDNCGLPTGRRGVAGKALTSVKRCCVLDVAIMVIVSR